MIAVAIVILTYIYYNSLDTEVAELPIEDTANIIGRKKTVGTVYQGLIQKLGVLVIGVCIFVQIIGCIYDATGKPSYVFFTELEGVFVPNGKEIVSVPAVYVLDIIF